MKLNKGLFKVFFSAFIMIGLFWVVGLSAKAAVYAHTSVSVRSLKTDDIIANDVTIYDSSSVNLILQRYGYFYENKINSYDFTLSQSGGNPSISTNSDSFIVMDSDYYEPADNLRKANAWVVKSINNNENNELVVSIRGTNYTVSYTADAGSNDITNEESDKLIDRNINTKWYCSPGKKSKPTGESMSCYWIDFHTSAPIKVNSYSLTTGNDNSTFRGRNPKSWVLKAKKDQNDPWTVIADVSNDTILEDIDLKTYRFNTNVTGVWQYYRLMISESRGGSNIGIQLSEMSLGYKEPPKEASISFRYSNLLLKQTEFPFQNVLNNTGNGKVTYSWDGSKAVSVDKESGVVNLLSGFGTPITITATVEDTDEYVYSQKSVSYTINYSYYILKSEIDHYSKTYSDPDFRLPITNDGPAKLTFKSGNEDVIKVDSETGKATIVDVGIAYISATVETDYQQFYRQPVVGLNVSVDKSTPEYTIPTGLKAEKGQSLREIELPDGWEWLADEKLYANEDGSFKTYPARFTPDDTRHYKTVDEYLEVNVVGADKTELSKLYEESNAFYNDVQNRDYYDLIKDDSELKNEMAKLESLLRAVSTRLKADPGREEINSYISGLNELKKKITDRINELLDDITYDISFETNGAATISTQTVKYGKKVSEPEKPKKEGFTFGGWYLDEKLEKAFKFDKPVTSSFTLYAKWEKIEETPDPIDNNANEQEENTSANTGENVPGPGNVAEENKVTENVDTTTVQAKASEKLDKKQKNTSVSKLKAGKKSMTVSWKKVEASGIKGYEIQYSTDKKFAKDVKVKSVNKVKTTSKKIKGLKSGKKFYVRIRTFKKSGTVKIYSKWSKCKNVKVK